MAIKPTYEDLEKRIDELEKENADVRAQNDAAMEFAARYLSVFESVPASLVFVDKGGKIIDINPYHVETIGRGNTTKEDYINCNILEHPSVVSAGLHDDYNRVLKGESIEKKEVYFPVTTGGTGGFFNIRGVPIFKDGEVTGAVMIHIDITELKNSEKCLRKAQAELELKVEQRTAEVTKLNEELKKDIAERKQAEDALKESESFTKVVLDNLPIGIAVNSVAPAVKFEYMNDNFPRFYRTSRQALADPDTFWDHVYEDPEFRKEIRRRVLEDCASGDPERMHWVDVPITRKDGDTSFITARNIPVPDKQLMISTVWDVTERKLAEEERDRLISAIEQAAETIVITDSGGVIQYVNPAFEQITGYMCEEAIGQTPRVLKSGAHDDAFYKEMWGTLTGGQTWRGRITNKRKDGTLYTEEAVISPVRNASGRTVNYVAVKRDITKEMKLEEQLRQAQKMESIGTLAGGIAHDFNNILFPILGNAEMLLEDIPEDSPLRDNLNEVFNGGLRAKELVKQILTFSRQHSNEIKLMRIQPVIKEALKLIRSTIPTSIEINRTISNDCGVVKADPTQIHQVIMNLATNAYHAMEDTGGELKVGLNEIEFGDQDLPNPDMVPGRYACLTVSDTGTGMDKDVRGKIFDPFFTTKEQGKGTGMGLSVIHGIVLSAGGSIQVFSEPGKGTDFHVYLPVVKRSFEKPATQTKNSIQRGTEHILLVDDEDAIISMEKQMLERLGYSVVSCTRSVDALEAFRANPDIFDLVITDMAMPNMTGDNLASELVKIRPDIPILLCTGFSEKIPEEKAESMGIKGFLMKPIVKKDLSGMIRKILKNKTV